MTNAGATWVYEEVVADGNLISSRSLSAVSGRAVGKAHPTVIRRLREAHVDSCARIVTSVPLWQRYGMTLPKARRMIREALRGSGAKTGGSRPAGEFAVATQAGRVVGLVWFLVRGAFGRSGYVKWLGVAPEARGHGVGRSLLEHAERRIFRSCADVFLLASDFNLSAQEFYARHGYEQVGAIPDYVVKGITELVFRKRTTKAAPAPVVIKEGGKR